MLKLKDWFTLGSLVVAVVAVVFAFAGDLGWACGCVMVAWAFDAMDGLVARLTRSGNRFGAALDDQVDHFAYTVAPAFIVFNAYAPTSLVLALGLCAWLLALGTIRLARGQVAPVSWPGYWVGLPRPASGFTIAFFVNSTLFTWPTMRSAGAVLLVALGLLGLTALPYRNHKKPFTPVQTAAIIAVPVVCVGLSVAGQTWNAALAASSLYLVSPWIIVSGEERARLRALVREAQRSLA
jgi:CDP-diacylglycerol--serine O-phosphatidyltransferase